MPVPVPGSPKLRPVSYPTALMIKIADDVASRRIWLSQSFRELPGQVWRYDPVPPADPVKLVNRTQLRGHVRGVKGVGERGQLMVSGPRLMVEIAGNRYQSHDIVAPGRQQSRYGGTAGIADELQLGRVKPASEEVDRLIAGADDVLGKTRIGPVALMAARVAGWHVLAWPAQIRRTARWLA